MSYKAILLSAAAAFAVGVPEWLKLPKIQPLELGDFESGVLAGCFGAVPAAAMGGVGTLLAVALWVVMFPTLRNRRHLLRNPA